MKKVICILCMFVTVFALVGCLQPDSINYDKTTVSLKVGENFKFEIDQNVGYLCEENGVLSFNSATSTITALEVGTAKVTIYLVEKDSIKKEITVTVTAAAYTISYDLDGGNATGLITSFNVASEVTLPTPTKEGYDFLGWYEGTIRITVITNKSYTLVAKWQIIEPETYTITYDLDGGVASGLVESFKEGDTVVLPTPTKEGYDFLGWYEGTTKITAITDKNYTLVAKWEKIVPVSIEISKSVDDEIIYLDTICTLTCVVLPAGADQEVTWRAVNSTRAKLDSNGKILIVADGVPTSYTASFEVTSVADPSIKSTIVISFRPYVDPIKFMDSIQVANPVAMDIKSYTDDIGTAYYLLGGVVNYLFEGYSVTQNMVPVGAHNRPGTTVESKDPGEEFNVFSARYVTIHDVGAPSTALANSNYCVNPGPSTYVSWHYTVGNEGIWQQLPLDEIGYHAGDGTPYGLKFFDSGVKAPAGDDTPAVITVNQVTGKFMVNGVESKVTVPLSGDGDIVKNSELPSTGINNYVDSVTGNYMISRTWWNTSFGGVLANYGGNLNSIGIESAVNIGSNIYYTWELMAKLVAKEILPKTGLQPRDVKQHNTFSGKNCPQTMRRADMWQNFMNLVEAEYIIARQFYAFDITFSSDSPYLNSNGMIKKLPDVATNVTYSITMNNNKDFNHTFTYTVKLPAASTINYKIS